MERAEISRRFAQEFGLPGAVGVVDGTYVYLSQRPAVDGEVFWCRKHRYALNVQLVCDDQRRITYYQLGWPGSVYDSTVFSESFLYRNAREFFSLGEFLLADSGYGATCFICTPYRQPAASLDYNKVFNELFSRARVVIEHVNGILKGRFSSLRGIRIQIKEKQQDRFKKINEWILVCLILHNMLIDFGDTCDFEEEDEDIEGDNFVPNIAENVSANNLRLRVQQTVLTWYGQNC
jgi:hypothetical protein